MILAAVSVAQPQMSSKVGASCLTGCRSSSSRAWISVGESSTVLDLGAGESGDNAVELGQPSRDGGEVFGPPECPGGRFVAGVEFVQMPTEPVDYPGPLSNQVVSVVTEQSNIAGWAVELRSG